MATVLSVGDVVKFDVTFVEQMFKKLAVRRTAAPSFCLLVSPASNAGAEQAVFVDLASGAVERAQRPAPITLRFAPADLEATLQGRIADEDFQRRVDVEASPPSALGALFTALLPEAPAAQGAARDVATETIVEKRYASAGKDAMIDEQGRRVKGRPQSFKVKAAAAPAAVSRVVIGATSRGRDTHAFARDNLLRVLRPLATFAGDQQGDALRVVAGMASVKSGDEWSELGRLGD